MSVYADGLISPQDAAAVDFKCPKHGTDLMREIQRDCFDSPAEESWVCYACNRENREKAKGGE